MIRLLLKKQICMEVGYMLGSLIVLFLFMIVVGLSGGLVIGKLFWTPPTSNKKGI